MHFEKELIFVSGGPSCGKCMVAQKSHKDLKTELDTMGVHFGTLLAEDDLDYCARHGISSVPQYVYYSKGCFIGLIDGMASINDIKKAINDFHTSGLVDSKLKELGK